MHILRNKELVRMACSPEVQFHVPAWRCKGYLSSKWKVKARTVQNQRALPRVLQQTFPRKSTSSLEIDTKWANAAVVQDSL
jgi:hypothetical protein